MVYYISTKPIIDDSLYYESLSKVEKAHEFKHSCAFLN